MYKSIRIGIIGAGYIARYHLQTIKHVKNLSVVGITSRTIKKASKLANEFNIKKVYVSPIDLMNSAGLDGVLVLVNAENIFDVTKKIIPFKIPIFLEKPPGISLSETMILYR